MSLSPEQIDMLRRELLGSGQRWDDGELAHVLINGLTLSSIEKAPGLLSLPWPTSGEAASLAATAQRELSRMIGDSDDQNLQALKALTETRKPIATRLAEVAHLFGHTTSRTGRNHLKQTILPWFFDYLIERLQNASNSLRGSQDKVEGSGVDSMQHRPLADLGTYRAELQSPIDPPELADVLKHRLIQAALDVSDLDDAVRLAQIAATNGADLVEIGDPLIKRFGMKAVRQIREAIPGMPIVVEFSSSDWVDEQVELAVEAGADIVFVLGLDHPSRIERAVRTARNHRAGIVLAVPAHVDVVQWCRTVESAGADALSVIRNIDSAESTTTTNSRIREIGQVANIPLVISGGFTPHNVTDVLDDDWSILIIGGAFVHGRDPGNVLRSIRSAIDSVA